MPDLLEYPGELKSLRDDSLRQPLRGTANDPFPSVNNEKDIYLHVIQLSSSRNVQENWPRIVRHATHSISESLCLDLAELEANCHEDEAVVISLVQKFVARAIRSSRKSKSSWEIICDAAARLTESASRFEPRKDEGAPRESFLDRALRLDQRGQVDAALDLLYDSFDGLFRRGEFERADSLLSQLSADKFSADVLLGILTATLPARSRLPSRPRFYHAVESTLRGRGELEDGLLTGL